MKISKIKEIFSSDFIETIIIAFLAVFAIPVISSLVILSYSTTSAREEIAKSDKIMIKTIYNYIDNEVSSVVPIVTSLTQNGQLKDFFSCISEKSSDGELIIEAYKMADELKKIVADNPMAEDVYIVFNEKDSIVSPVMFESKKVFFDKFYKNSDLSYDKWNDMLLRSTYGQYLIINDRSGKYIDFCYSTSFFENKVNVPATIVVRISEKHFTDYISKIYDFDKKQIYVVDRNNQKVLDYGSRILPKLSYDNISSYADDEQTDEYMFTSLKANNNNWKYVLCTDNSLVKQKTYYNKLIAVISIVFYLLMLIAFLCVFMYKNYLPIKRIISIVNGETRNKYEFLENIVSEYRTYKSYTDKYKKQFDEVQKDKIFNKLVSFEQSITSVEKNVRDIGLNFISDYFVVLLIDAYNFESLFEEEAIDEAERYDSAGFIIKNIFEEFFEKTGQAYVFPKNDKFVCVLNLKNDSENWKNDIVSALEYGKSLIEKQFNIFMSINISNIYCGIENIRVAYNEVTQLYKKSKFFRNKEIVFYDELFQEISGGGLDDEIIENFTSFIQAGDGTAANELFKNMVDVIVINAADADSEFKMFAIKMMNVISSVLSTEDTKKKEFYIVINKILEFESYDKCMQYFENLITYVCGCIIDAEKKNEERSEESQIVSVANKNMVERIKKYVAEQFNDSSISMTSVGDYLNSAPYYVARVFKTVTGENLPDYISRYRVEKAKEFLRENEKIPISKLYEIVGFGSERTFMRMFARYENISVGQYKKMIKKAERKDK